MVISQTLVNEIVKRILGIAEPERIILFGSAATEQMTKDSDIDLLVLESAPSDTRMFVFARLYVDWAIPSTLWLWLLNGLRRAKML